VLLGAAALFGLLVVAVFWLSTSLGDGPVREIGYGEFASLVESGVTVVDIREPWEWEQTGVIEGSHLITAFDAQGRLQPDFLPRFTTLVQPDDEVVLICRTGIGPASWRRPCPNRWSTPASGTSPMESFHGSRWAVRLWHVA